MTARELVAVTITTAPDSPPHVTLNGVELPAPEGIAVDIDTTGAPVVTLAYPCRVVELEGDAIANTIRPPEPGEVLAVAGEWLAGLDPVELRALVDARATTLRQDPYRLVLDVLAEAARAGMDNDSEGGKG